MIVDCHTHIWATPQQLGAGSAASLRRQMGEANPPANAEAHWAAAECVDCSFVLGFRSELLGAEIPNEMIAAYVRQHPDRLVGMAGLDPLAPDVDETMAEIVQLGVFAGVTLSPSGQGFHPADTRVERVYQFCVDKGLLVVMHQGAHFGAAAKMEFAQPFLLDHVLRGFPALRMVIAHVGYPWYDETISLLGKHEHVYADIAGLIRRPWYGYNVLVGAHQFGVADKLLFGSGFPFIGAGEAVERMYRINEIAHGTNLPLVPREVLRGIVERDALAALAIRAK